MTVPQIRRVAGDRFATRLLREINANPERTERPCPFCAKPMRMFAAQAPPLELDACKPCGVVWFDPAEFDQVPAGAMESTDELRLRGIEADATRRIEQRKERALATSGPDLGWKTIPALFGFPVESETAALSRKPWLTWSLALIISLVSLAAFGNLENAVSGFAFVPSKAWRYGGVTLISSFFLHAGLLHLMGNVYFLLIFGDNVEDYLGRWQYALLILAATLAGDVTHWLVQAHSTIPCIGASGGISGIIVFYALQFPRARLGFLFRYFFYFRWVQIPAWGALALWLLLQVFTAYLQSSGSSNVAATAHLGGAAAGLVTWIIARNASAARSVT